MRSFILYLLALGTFYAQGQSCCQSITNTQAFASLSTDAKFGEAHVLRTPPSADLMGKMISYPVQGGENASAYEVAEGPFNGKVILVFQEWWGLNDHIKEQADKLAKTFPGVRVIAPDLYDGMTATTREAASKLMQNANEERIRSIIKAAYEYTDSKNVATIGWCFGGGWSLRAALIGSDRVNACIMYYGMPIDDPSLLKGLQAPVLGIFAKQDGWINQEVVGKFENAMEEAGRPLKVYWYDAPHAFANPSQPSFNGEAAIDAWMKTVDFLERNL